MKNIAYFGRDGRLCQRNEWARLRDDPSYRIVRQYDNGSIRIQVEWLGEVTDPQNLFPDMYRLFRINVWNYDAYNVLRPDPVRDGDTYPTEKTAIKAYEEFLLDWTNCSVTEDGDFIEEDNSLAPPPPLNPDAPTSEVTAIKGITDDGVGAW
jgi:hypothetical protein